jgi:3'-phosphoadenosine 5'-phosphosulfate (PAPS) 3'-phosphatase
MAPKNSSINALIFTVNIGFIDKTAPVCGIVYAPALCRLFFSLDGRAYETDISPDDKIINDEDALHSKLSNAKEIRVRPTPDDGLVVVASRLTFITRNRSFFERTYSQRNRICRIIVEVLLTSNR